MYVFSYEPETLAFRGGIPAEFDQLEPGRLICPAFCTRTPIPRFDAVNEWPFYLPDPADPEGGSWELRQIEKPAPEPDTPADEPTTPDGPTNTQRVDAILEAIRLHLQAVERLRAQMSEAEAADAGGAVSVAAARGTA